MDELRLANQTPSSLTLQWDPLYEEPVHYLVYWDEGGDSVNKGVLVKLGRTSENTFTVRLRETGKFLFLVKAETECGIGPYSPELIVEKSKVPNPVYGVTT